MKLKFPTNQGYVCIQKWCQIFVWGTSGTQTESEENAILVSGQKFYANICKKEFAQICFNPKI